MTAMKRLLPLLLCLPLLTGCFYSREMVGTKRAIERELPDVELDREVTLSVGPLALRFTRFVTGFVRDEDAQMARAYLRDISRVKVGVYDVAYLPTLDDFDPMRLRRFRDDWEVAVKVREDDQFVWVLYRPERDTVRDLYVLVLSEDELVMARVKGHLNRLVARVMEDHHPLTEMDWAGL